MTGVLAGQAALVTGGDSGIGAEVCRVLAAAGAVVAINYHRDAAAAEALRDEIARTGGRAIPAEGGRLRRGRGGRDVRALRRPGRPRGHRRRERGLPDRRRRPR
jgi:Dehydrogenases with different specificities (related to short-chain alcohol dehydrogenases)